MPNSLGSAFNVQGVPMLPLSGTYEDTKALSDVCSKEFSLRDQTVDQ